MGPPGSSPLARGLPPTRRRPISGPRIIPARAGFTSSPARLVRWTGGSSPLARGLLTEKMEGRIDAGIIPARAGFTNEKFGLNISCTDHPRSRGVYRDLRRSRHDHAGIIPARAGFTLGPCTWFLRASDHPRSRGVYQRRDLRRGRHDGSSPLARGLLQGDINDAKAVRIIPARAGFTWVSSPTLLHQWDHPRSRGVYTCGSLESQRRATLPDRVHLHCRPSARSAEFR